MEKHELISAISAVLCRRPHWNIIQSNHAADMMATDIVKMLEDHAESAEYLFDDEKDETEQTMAVPLSWMKTWKSEGTDGVE